MERRAWVWTKRRAIIVGILVYVVVVLGLYAVIYAGPRIAVGRIPTNIVEYAQVPIADQVTALFVRDETLYTAAYTGKLNYMVSAGTKVRSGTQVLYIEPGTPPTDGSAAPENEAVPEKPGDLEKPADSEKQDEPEVQGILTLSGVGAVASEGGVTPTTAIVSYYADGWEKKVTPDNILSLSKEVFTEAPREATDLTREWAEAGEPVYRITNNNLWRVAFWIENADKTMLDKYQLGKRVTLDLGTTKVRASVETAEPRGKDIFVVLRSDMYYKELDRYRLQDISVVFSEVSGAVIEKKAVKLKTGQTGVYVKQLSGAFKWVPIKVLKESDGRYVVSETSFQNQDGKNVTTVKYYDEIMSDPAKAGY